MTPVVNEIYRHFKGNSYKVIAIAKHSETREQMVVYQALYGDYDIYVRPYESFVSKVDKEKYPDASQEYRFEPITSVGVVAQPVTPDSDSVKEDNVTDGAKSGEGSADALLKPLVVQFLDSDSLDEKKNILVRLHDTIEQDDITIMATTMDIDIDEELDVEARYRQLMTCLDTKSRFETSRLRSGM